MAVLFFCFFFEDGAGRIEMVYGSVPVLGPYFAHVCDRQIRPACMCSKEFVMNPNAPEHIYIHRLDQYMC